MTPRIEIGQSVFSDGFAAHAAPLGSPIALFADQAIASTHGERLLASLKRRGLAVELFALPSGESAKTREVKQRFEDQLLEKRYGRDCLILALGGGATTDLVGFLASTYLRGVPLILIPSTFLAMVDAAVGSKNGVNTPLGKNLIGTVYDPLSIWMDLSLLDTLPEREWLNGLAEVLKLGLIADPALWEEFEREGFNRAHLKRIIERSVAGKLRIVEQDPEERTSLRSVLNFGHTTAHAIERMDAAAWSHGEAVAIGCIGGAYLSHRLGHLSSADLERVHRLIRSLGFPFRPLPKQLLEAMSRDKKVKQGLIRFVLLDGIGRTLSTNGEYTHVVPEAEIEAMLHWLDQLMRS